MSNLDNFETFEDMCESHEIKSMVGSIVASFYGLLDPDEIESEVNLTLFNVWKQHDQRRGKVSTYLFRALKNNLVKLVKRKEKQPTYISVVEDIFPSKEE